MVTMAILHMVRRGSNPLSLKFILKNLFLLKFKKKHVLMAQFDPVLALQPPGGHFLHFLYFHLPNGIKTNWLSCLVWVKEIVSSTLTIPNISLAL